MPSNDGDKEEEEEEEEVVVVVVVVVEEEEDNGTMSERDLAAMSVGGAGGEQS